MMAIINLLLLFGILFISYAICKDENVYNANVENLKILRKSVNFAYQAGNYFLDLIRGSTPPDKPGKQAFNIIMNNNLFKLTDLVPIYLPYVGFITLVFVGLIFVVLIPIVGFCFCCCRCSGKCGGRIKGMDPKHAICKRYAYALFLGIISMVQLAGIVLAFINNQLIHDTLTSPSVEISAVKQLSLGTNLLRSSLKNISGAIKASDISSGNNLDIKNDFLDVTCFRYLSVIQNDSDYLNIDKDLGRISLKLNNAVDYLNEVKIGNANLQNYAKDFKREIFNLKLVNIKSQVCDMLSKIIGTGFDDLNALILGQIKVGTSTKEKLERIVNFFNNSVLQYMDSFMANMDEYMKVEFLEYRMYICIGVCCLLLLIVLFYFLGLCFGQCGERPFEDARICNRGVGANLMMAGVAFAFLFTPMIMMFEIYLFMSGGIVQTDICRYLTNSYDPGVVTLDSVLQTIPDLKDNIFIKNNILDSIFNKCPTEPMTIAFKIDDSLMSPEVSQKVKDISAKIETVPRLTVLNLINGYFKIVEGLLVNISAEIGVNTARYDGFDDRTKKIIIDKLTYLSTEISTFSLATVKEKLKNSFDKAALTGFKPALKAETIKVLSKIHLSSYKHVRCDGIYRSAITIVESTCVTFLWPFNGFWFGVGICLIFTIPAIIFAVKLAGLYRRTEKYSADYEEPDYHSYMGFYTNNADNIPMKRPKSAKSNHKNRNSNSNNKEALKQNNPQYLPVYPYDAYE